MERIFSINRKIDKIDVYRIHDWLYHLGFIILGTLIADKTAGIGVFTLLICSFALAFIYALNDFTDHEKKSILFIYPLVLLIICGHLISSKQWVPLALFLALQIIYSVKPFRFKKIPIIGTLCCMLAFPQIFLIGYFEVDNFDLRSFSIFLLLTLLLGIMQLVHEVRDIDEDVSAGINTSAVFYGKKIINYVCMIFSILGIGVSVYLCTFRIINMVAFMALSIFQLYMLGEIFFKGITFKTRFRFRMFGLFSGTVWFISIFL
ncbi:MAG: UbiA family prenyltransferase [Candidatus Kaelpia aquatica]|nr:UbiA family prenyltransferase [Candidatus Kaelpia aquatica]